MNNSFVQKVLNIFFLLILPLSLPCEKETLFIITDDQERREFNFLDEGKTEHGQPVT